MIAIIDYGVGNLQSIQRALELLNRPCRLVRTRQELETAKGIILPGVGAFDAALTALEEMDLIESLKQAAGQDMPILGICLGMQILFERSEEGSRPGLGLLKGEVLHLPHGLRVPHLGWNWVQWKQSGGRHGHYYFAHSYHACTPQENMLAQTQYGVDFASVVNKGSIHGVQFHPEKSGREGLALLGEWTEGRMRACC